MLLVLVVVLIFVVGSWLSLRANELFFISIRDGRMLVVRGRVPAALLDAFSDVVTDARVTNASVRAMRDGRHARLVLGGVDDGTAQRLRNVFGIHPMHELRSAPPASDRNLGQALGWAWLAWLLLRR